MSKTKKIIIITAAAVVLIIGLLISQLVIMSMPTKGEIIAPYENPQKALLVIDIQEDFTGTTARPPFPYKDSAKLIAMVNTIIDTAFVRNINIVYIRQELDSFMGKLLSRMFIGGAAIKGDPGTEIDKRVSILTDNLFPKPKSDAFSNPELEEYLIKNQVNELYLVGLDAAGCVHMTARGALNRGYKVNIITNAVVLQDEEEWEDLLKEYREEGIILLSAEDFMSRIP